MRGEIQFGSARKQGAPLDDIETKVVAPMKDVLSACAEIRVDVLLGDDVALVERVLCDVAKALDAFGFLSRTSFHVDRPCHSTSLEFSCTSLASNPDPARDEDLTQYVKRVFGHDEAAVNVARSSVRKGGKK